MNGRQIALPSTVIKPESIIPGFEIGHSTESKTRSISVHPVDDIYLMDTPGFEDTDGVELDMANYITVSNTLRRAKSIRPVVVISESSIKEGRGDNFRQILNLLQNLFIDFPKYQNRVNFFITKANEVSNMGYFLE